MRQIILLDTGVLGMLTYPRKNPQIRPWLQHLRRTGYEVRVPEIADYEIRRELLRLNNRQGLERLDSLKNRLGTTRITTAVMLQAAEFWAAARRGGYAAADDQSLDGDMILAAQAHTLRRAGNQVVIATSNVGHFTHFVAAEIWSSIR